MDELTAKVETTLEQMARILERLDALEQRVSWTQERHETWIEARRREIERVGRDLDDGVRELRSEIDRVRRDVQAASRRGW